MNPVALITGASRGIGRGIALELAKGGFDVAINYAGNVAAANQTSSDCVSGSAAIGKTIRAEICQADIAKSEDRQRLIQFVREKFGRLDVLVNNAAITNTSKWPSMSIEEYGALNRASIVSLDEVRAIWETNVFGVLTVYQAMLPLLRKAPAARIVNVSSGGGSLTRMADPAVPGRQLFGPGYSASKAALNALTLAMAIELESTGIKVNACSPGFIKTNFNNGGTGTVEEGAREPVRLALLGPDGPTVCSRDGKRNDPMVIHSEGDRELSNF
jgi:NAD(P)-dependent dehydrogenase (short-subunit alcohol dehydrogenase family)